MIRLFVFLLQFTTLVAGAASPIPLSTIAPTNRTPVDSLVAISQNSQYRTCKDDLKIFVNSLSAKDEKELTQLREKFDGRKLKDFMTLKKAVFATASKQDVLINQKMKSGHFLVQHGGLKCQISVYVEFDSDGIKSNVDPNAADVKISENFLVDAALVGSSADPVANSEPHMDPSKALTILRIKLDIKDQSTQIKFLEEFQDLEAKGMTSVPAAKPVK